MKILLLGKNCHHTGALTHFIHLYNSISAEFNYVYVEKRQGETSPLLPFSSHFYELTDKLLIDFANNHDLVIHSGLNKENCYKFKQGLKVPDIEVWHSKDQFERIWKQYYLRLTEVEKQSTAMVAISPGLEKFIKKCHIDNELSIDHISCIPLGIKAPDFISRTKYLFGAISYVGRISQDKNIYDLLRVFKILHKRLPNVPLQIIGHTSPEIDKASFDLIKELCDYIKFIPYQTDLSEYYANTSILISCSKSEGMPYSFLEASSYGVDCIGYDTGDIAYLRPTIDIGANTEQFAQEVINRYHSYSIDLAVDIAGLTNLDYSLEKFNKNWSELINKTIN